LASGTCYLRRDQAGRGRKRNLVASEESDRLFDLAASDGGSGGGRRDKKIIPFSPRSSAAGPMAARGSKTIARVKRRIIGNR